MATIKSPYKFAVLVVDDEKDILDLFERFFNQNNIEVFTADSAERALYLTAKHPHIKIVITDLYMPKSCIDGKTLALILMEREPRTVVFAMTGYSDKFSLDDCLRIGFRDYLIKPISFPSLLHTIHCVCHQMRRWEKIK